MQIAEPITADQYLDVALEFDRSATLASSLLPGFKLAVGELFDFG
ncbi:MAG: hypothetical protein WKF48_12740 [Solirubrobacteraceae bacterium]